MRKLLTLLFVCSGLGAASLAQAADGSLAMSWETCTPPVDPTAANKIPGTTKASLIFSVTGNDQTHNAYQVRFLVSAANRTTPDAWRFDNDGCQGDALLAINNFPPAAISKACPAFKGASALEIKGYDNVNPTPDQPYLATQMRGNLAVTYPPTVANPATRYFLAQFEFDHLFSVDGAGDPPNSCGGNDVPVCFALLRPSGYVRVSDGIEYPFAASNSYVTYGATPLAGCPETPAKAATWGQIKSQYRN